MLHSISILRIMLASRWIMIMMVKIIGLGESIVCSHNILTTQTQLMTHLCWLHCSRDHRDVYRSIVGFYLQLFCFVLFFVLDVWYCSSWKTCRNHQCGKYLHRKNSQASWWKHVFRTLMWILYKFFCTSIFEIIFIFYIF